MTESNYIAYGGGVGSTKLLLDYINKIRKGDLEVIYSNHLGDLPETSIYIDYIKDILDIDITILNGQDLYDYCWKRKILPSIHWRWCTDKFKIRPMKRYVDGDVPIIGLTYDEKSRSKGFYYNGKSEFPLIRDRVTRQDAIESFNFEVPCKSGCFFCPFQMDREWRKLYRDHYDLFMKAMLLEEHAKERNPNIWLRKDSLRSLMNEIKYQRKLVDFHD